MLRRGITSESIWPKQLVEVGRPYTLIAASTLATLGLGWAAFTWYQNDQAVAAVDRVLLSVVENKSALGLDSGAREVARERADGVRAQLEELSHRLFVNEERLKALSMKVDWFESRLDHAEEVIQYERCNAEV